MPTKRALRGAAVLEKPLMNLRYYPINPRNDRSSLMVEGTGALSYGDGLPRVRGYSILGNDVTTVGDLPLENATFVGL